MNTNLLNGDPLKLDEVDKELNPVNIGLIIGGTTAAIATSLNVLEGDIHSWSEQTALAMGFYGITMPTTLGPVFSTMYEKGKKVRATIQSAIGMALPMEAMYGVAKTIEQISTQ